MSRAEIFFLALFCNSVAALPIERKSLDVIAYCATDVYIDIYQMHLRQCGHVFGG